MDQKSFEFPDEKTAANVADVARETFGEQRAADVERLFQDPEKIRALLTRMGEQDRAAVMKILSDPSMLRSILSSPRAMEGLNRILGGGNGHG